MKTAGFLFYLGSALAICIAAPICAAPPSIQAQVRDYSPITVAFRGDNSLDVRFHRALPLNKAQIQPEDSDPIVRLIAAASGQELIIQQTYLELDDSVPSNSISPEEIETTLTNHPWELGENWDCGAYQLIPVRFNPYYINPQNGRINAVSYMELEITGADDSGLSLMRPAQRQALGGLLLNNRPSRDEGGLGGGYIYVLPDNNQVREIIRGLLDWRRLQGYAARELVLPQGADADWLHNELVRINQNNPVEFVCLVGDDGGPFSVPAGMRGASDYHYALLETNNPIPQAAVGRLSYNSIGELQRMVAKILAYEQQPERDNAPWMQRGAVAAGNEISGLSTILVSRWVREMMLEHGFNRVDTLWFTMGGSVASFMRRSFDNGTGFINYRGWTGMEDWTPQEAGRLNNRNLSVALLLGCNTGDFSGAGAGFTEALLRASGGAIGAMGCATAETRVNFNNALMAAYYQGVLEEGVTNLGWSLNRAKLGLRAVYNDVAPEWVTTHSYLTNLMGDPGTIIQRGPAREVALEAPNQFSIGGSLAVRVTSQGQPVAGARVGLYKPDQIASYAITDAEGRAALIHQPANVAAGEASLSVTGAGIVPLTRAVQVAAVPHLVLYTGSFLMEDNFEPRRGNADGVANPFEIITINIFARNVGAQAINGGINLVLTCDHPGINILQGVFNQGGVIAAGGMIQGSFLVGLTNRFPDRTPVPFSVRATAGNENWTFGFSIQGRAPAWEITGFFPNTPLMRGLERSLDITLRNIGAIDLEAVDAELSSPSRWIEMIRAEEVYAPAEIGQLSNTGEPFTFAVDGNAPFEAMLPFVLALTTDAGYEGQIEFELRVEPTPVSEVTGPDEYGYYAIDDEDSSSNVFPVNEWLEINPRLGGPGRDTELLDQGEDDDKSMVVDLPFNFRYYGQNFNRLTICTNGWAAFGDQRQFVDFRNLPVGTPQGPRAQLCPWWDDLYQPGAVGDVCYHYNEARHLFVVEWYRLRRWVGPTGPGALETFQIWLLDPLWHPNYTGDGDIVFQYREITREGRVDAHGSRFSTVGIGSPDDQGGLQFGYWNRWAKGANPVHSRSAIRFATAAQHIYGAAAGTVRDLANNQPLPGAVVRGSHGGWAVANNEGVYQISNILAELPTTLTASLPGYNDRLSREFNLQPDGQVQVDFFMTQPEIRLEEESVADTLDVGFEADHQFTIANAGNGSLAFLIKVEPHQNNQIRPSSLMMTNPPRVDECNELWEPLMGWNASELTGDQRLLGIVWTTEGIYVSGGDNGQETNYFYCFNRVGGYLGRIPQPVRSQWGMHDLAGTGDRIYGGCGDAIYIMDVNCNLITTLNSPLNPPRALAVDTESGEIYIGNNSDPICRMNAQGNILNRYSHRLRPYGMAWHPADPDHFPLYIFSADGETNLALSKLNPATGEIRMVAQFELEAGDRAGGCELSLGWDPHNWSLLTLIQNSNGDRVQIFDAGFNTAWIEIRPEDGQIEPNQEMPVTLTLSAQGLMSGLYTADLVISHNGPGGSARLPVSLFVEPEVARVDEGLPWGFDLAAIYPNPSNDAAVVSFSLSSARRVRLLVSDQNGRLVDKLISELLPAGSHKYILAAGSLPSGVYYVRLEAGKAVQTKKFVLLR